MNIYIYFLFICHAPDQISVHTIEYNVNCCHGSNICIYFAKMYQLNYHKKFSTLIVQEYSFFQYVFKKMYDQNMYYFPIKQKSLHYRIINILILHIILYTFLNYSYDY